MPLMHIGFRIDPHRAELDAHKTASQVPNPLLTKENRPGRNNLDNQPDKKPHRQNHWRRHENTNNVQDAFRCRNWTDVQLWFNNLGGFWVATIHGLTFFGKV